MQDPEIDGGRPPDSVSGRQPNDPNKGRAYGAGSNFVEQPTNAYVYSPGNFAGDVSGNHAFDSTGSPWQSSDPRFGHFANRMPASERLLQLEADMATVVRQNRFLSATNETLQKELTENRQLLTDVNQSIEQAVTQLKSAEQTNRMLRDQVAQLEREKLLQQEESARLLDDIRKQLNELLAQEINDNTK